MHIHNHIQHGSKMEIHELVPQLILTLPIIMALVIYLCAVILTKRRKKSWRFFRMVLWIGGLSCSLAAISGPIAARSHQDFTSHMLGHLLLGMLAPLLM